MSEKDKRGKRGGISEEQAGIDYDNANKLRKKIQESGQPLKGTLIIGATPRRVEKKYFPDTSPPTIGVSGSVEIDIIGGNMVPTTFVSKHRAERQMLARLDYPGYK